MSAFFTMSEVGVVTPVVRSLTVPMVHALGQQLLDLVQERGCVNLDLDLRNVIFLGAAALGLFVAVNKRLRTRGGRLGIRGVHPGLLDVFRAAHLDRVFEIHVQAHPRPLLHVPTGVRFSEASFFA